MAPKTKSEKMKELKNNLWMEYVMSENKEKFILAVVNGSYKLTEEQAEQIWKMFEKVA